MTPKKDLEAWKKQMLADGYIERTARVNRFEMTEMDQNPECPVISIEAVSSDENSFDISWDGFYNVTYFEEP